MVIGLDELDKAASRAIRGGVTLSPCALSLDTMRSRPTTSVSGDEFAGTESIEGVWARNRSIGARLRMGSIVARLAPDPLSSTLLNRAKNPFVVE